MMVEILAARPPTPPKSDRKDPSSLQTPEDTPPCPTNESTGDSSSRHQTKRVNFSPWTNTIKPPNFSNTPFKVLPPSNARKPAKSILKTTQSPAPVAFVDVTPNSPGMLLETIVHQLAGESMSARQDAYMQFLGVLKAYEGLPAEHDLYGRLGQITQFIQRDISKDLENGGPLDTNVVTCALKLAITFVWHPKISPCLLDDFKVFLVDRSINALQHGKLPKAVLGHYMHLLSTQNFGSRIVTGTRVSNLLKALHDLTDRVTGNAIVLQRLIIYQRILSTSKSTFISCSNLWIEHLISGLLHPFKDTRLRAISLGLHISMIFGPNPVLSKAVRDVFNRPINQKDTRLASEICERLSRMIGSVDCRVHVPQVWSVVILLLRNKRSNVIDWEHFRDWLFILQKCFNCSEPTVKAQAIVGWNRFIVAAGPSDIDSCSTLRMLGKPILSQFERIKQANPTSQPNELALSSYYNLLYYSFRPSVSLQHCDIIWDEFVALPSSRIFNSVPVLGDRIAAAISSLMWNSQAKVWSEDKANETGKINADDLPSLDCKWIRSRINSVLEVFESLFKSSSWIDNAIEESTMASAWIGLSRALSYASSREITPSAESMQAVAGVLGFFRRLWNTGPLSLNATGDRSVDKFFDRFRFLSMTMIFALGTIPFTEKLLMRTTNETFQIANTPQHRHSTTNNNIGSPLLHLLQLMSSGFPAFSQESVASYSSLVSETLNAACNGRTSRGSRLELLRQCADLYQSEAELEGHYIFCQISWKITAKFSADCLCSLPMESARERDGSISRDYDNAVKILTSGLTFNDNFKEWNQLLDSLVRVLRTEKGDRAISTLAIEPLSERMMLCKPEDTHMAYAAFFNHSLSLPYCNNDKPAAERNATGISTAESSQLLFPKTMMASAGKILREIYEDFDPSRTIGIADFLESLTSFLGSGTYALRVRVLESLQGPLSMWLRDDARKLNAFSGVDSRILTAVSTLSHLIFTYIS